MGTDDRCKCSGKHNGHICELDIRGELGTIKKITDDSVVYCASCGAEANSSEYVCSPIEIYYQAG